MTEVVRDNTLWLDGHFYRTEGPVLPTLVTPLAPKITTGEHSRDSEPIRSSTIFENFSGGLGVKYLDPAKHTDRYFFGTLDTRYERSVLLPPLAVEAGTGRPASTRIRDGIAYGTTLYVAWDTKIRFLNSDDEWETPAEASYVDLSAVATDAFVLRLAAVDWLVFADSNGYLTFDGTTWTYIAGNGTTLPQARYLTEWDNRLWAMDANNRLWATTDLVTWTGFATLPLHSGEVAGLTTFLSKDDVVLLHAPTREGLWQYDATTDVWYRTRVRFPRQPQGGTAWAEWRGDFYIAAGLPVYRFTSTVLSPMGLDRDWGLPPDYRGNVTGLVDLFNWLVAAVSATGLTTAPAGYGTLGSWFDNVLPTSAGLALVLAWTGTGWHPLWSGALADDVIDWLYFDTTDADAPRLWFGASNTAYYLPVPPGLFNPREIPTWEYAPSGYLETGWDHMGWAEQVKVALDLTVRLINSSATEYCDVYYALDNNPAWTALGRIDSDTETALSFGAAGITFHTIRFRFELARGADATDAPIFDFATLTWIRRLPRRYGYAATILVVDDDAEGRTPAEQLDDLRTTVETDTLVALAYRRTEQELVERRVIVTQWGGGTFTGTDERGRLRLAFVEA